MLYSRNQVLALAPDFETKRSANNFSRPKQWTELEGNENILWGTCKTYNRKYKTWVSLSKQRYKCSCKNKMPCRHALGMLLIYIEQSDSFRVTYDLPKNISNWLEGKVELAKAVDPKRMEQNRLIRLQNWEKRMASMSVGLDELEIWLQDILRQGLAELETQAPEFWSAIASRMVDTKLGSIARRIRLMPDIIQSNDDWYTKILAEIGDIYLIIKGFRNMSNLPDNLQKEMLNLAGVNYKKEDLLKEKGHLDNWIILGQVETAEENLRARRTWLLAEGTKQWALFLEFAWGRQNFEYDWKVGTIIQSELVYYPSSFPIRAISKSHEVLPRDLEVVPAYPNLTAFMSVYSKALVENPWVHQFPLCVKDVVPVLKEEQFYLKDAENKGVPIKTTDTIKWKLLAISGGHPIRIFGEWEAEVLHPRSAFVEGRLIVF